MEIEWKFEWEFTGNPIITALLMGLNVLLKDKTRTNSNDTYVCHDKYRFYLVYFVSTTKDFIWFHHTNLSIQFKRNVQRIESYPSLSPPTSHGVCPGVASVSSAAARSVHSENGANGAVGEDLTWLAGLVLPTCQGCRHDMLWWCDTGILLGHFCKTVGAVFVCSHSSHIAM